jgi:two-component system, NarL family, sensor kinase
VRVLRSPVTLFLLVGTLTVTAIVIGTGFLADRAASDEAEVEARNTARVVGAFVVAPKVTPALVHGRSGAIDRFDTKMLAFLKDSPIDHVTIIDRGGRIVYADDISRIGETVELTASQQRVLRRGGTGSRDASPIDAGLPAGRNIDPGPLLQTWTGLRQRGTPPLLFEAYFSLENVQSRRQEIYSSFRWITIGPLLLLMLTVVLMLRLLTRQVARGAAERERLLRQAIDASDAERRRIARDLHDSVVQDLAGTAFSISALSRDAATDGETRSSLQRAGRSLREGLTSLRSLLVEIHPPELRAESLPAALADLTAPADASGIQALVSVEGAETASDERAALVWRVAQEAVRNALRHSAASTLAVTVRGDGRRLTLEVVDDGVGFDPAAVRDPEHFGLRGLRSLVAEAGGTLEVRSSPHEGTTVRMEVDAR